MKSENLQMLLAFVLVLAILFIWQLVFLPRRPQTQPVPAAPAGPTSPTSETVPAQPQPAPGLTSTASPVPETTVTLQNQFISLKLTSQGGAVKQVRLGKYNAELIPTDSTLLATVVQIQGQSYDLAHWPVTVSVSDSSVTFSYALDAGPVTKTWTLGKDYTVGLTIKSASGLEALFFDCRAGISTTEQNFKEDLANFHFYAREGSRVHQVSYAQLKRRPFSCPADWLGLKSKYFLVALVRRNGRFDSTYALARPDGRIGCGAVSRTLRADSFWVYLGPIEYNRLRSFRLGLENVVSLGWLKPIALGILWVLRLFYALFRNWGLAIIGFSVLMKGAFYPLTRTQTRQLRQMQQLQPKIEELRRKYKDDPKMLNEETMRLYRLYKINPLSGCLPLLVQMPIFFALYAVLRTFIELRGARFGLWLNDLSLPDTLFGHIPRGVPIIGGYALGLLPLLMGVSFIGQNLLTATDKRNWTMTILFPVFITAIFLNLSSGLQLYWFSYNVLSIVESVIATKGGKLWVKSKSQTRPTGPTPNQPPPARTGS